MLSTIFHTPVENHHKNDILKYMKKAIIFSIKATMPLTGTLFRGYL